MPNLFKIGQLLAKILRFYFSTWQPRHLGFLNLWFWKLQYFIGCRVYRLRCISISISMPNVVKISCEAIKIFQFFKMAAVRHLGFVWGLSWMTHEEYLVVSITPQSLVTIDAVVLKIRRFQYLAQIARKGLFVPQKLRFGAIWPPKWAIIWMKPKKAHSCMSPRHLSHQRWKSNYWSDV